MKETNTKGVKNGAYLCQKCRLLQSLYDWEIERTVADEYCFWDKFKCNYCSFMNEYRFPR
jgi:hypothetical protein